jgi:hypothetical protein
MSVSDTNVSLLSAHQPVYLPWLGLFHKIEVADLFVIFDAVPYSRKMWYNRNRILGVNGEVMLTVPVYSKGSREILHKDIQIRNDLNWASKHWKTIEAAYQKAPFFGEYAGGLKAIYDENWYLLIDLNEAILRLIAGWLQIKTPIVRASSYDFKGHKSELILDMCLQLKANFYLFGALGRDYADQEAFRQKGVTPLFQDYVHPSYRQKHPSFVPYMSAIDLIFNHGEKSRDILLSSNLTQYQLLA